MFEFQKRQRVRRLLHSRYAFIVLLVVMLLVARAVWGIYGKYEKSKDIALRAQEELVALEERQRDLMASIASLKTPEGEEKELRSKFGVVKEGEKLIILVDEREPNIVLPVVESKKWWQKLIEVLK